MKKDKILTERVTVTIKQNLLYTLRRYSERTNRSLSNTMNNIIDEYLRKINQELNHGTTNKTTTGRED